MATAIEALKMVGTRVRLERPLFGLPPDVRVTGVIIGTKVNVDGSISFVVEPDPKFSANATGVVWHEDKVTEVRDDR